MKEEQVVLVDEQDNALGVMEKLQAHIEGALHRALSVLIFTSTGKMLLQKRALNKYHSPGLWSNSCCTHPQANESPEIAARRRLKEEMGLDCLNLEYAFRFIYSTTLNNELIEHELDHVFIGITDDIPVLNRNEVSEYCYKDLNEIAYELTTDRSKYTAWFPLILEQYKKSKRTK